LRQAETVALTLSQTIYLMNSACGREGYFYIRVNTQIRELIRGWMSLQDIYSAAEQDNDMKVLKSLINGGLKLFGLQDQDVVEVNGFPLQMMRVDKPYKVEGRIPIFLIGEAAMRLNFWPGR
jgi:hypothetical protein